MPLWLRMLAGVGTVAVVTGVLVLWGHREHWDTPTSVGVAALAVSVGGFVVAITEIRNATTATKATKDAVRRTLAGVAASRLIESITLLRQATTELEEAADDNDIQNARRAINTWRSLGSGAEGALRRRFGKEHPVLASLQASLETARETKPALYEEGKQVREVTSPCLTAMEGVSDELGPLLDQLLPTIDEANEHT